MSATSHTEGNSFTEFTELHSEESLKREAVQQLGKEEEAGVKRSAVPAEQHADALAWFLSPEDDTDLSHTFQINVGGVAEEAKWVEWTVGTIDSDTLKRIRKQNQPRPSKRGAPAGEMDDTAANIAIIVAGTISPDLRDASSKLGVVSPEFAVKSRFQHKPGLLTQIANEIMTISGYDEDDLREVGAAQG